jgi:hypothetical protein
MEIMEIVLGFANPVVRPIPINTTIANSITEWPVAINGPTTQPRRGAWLTIAVVTGPGDTTAPNPVKKEKMKTAVSEDVGIKLLQIN